MRQQVPLKTKTLRTFPSRFQKQGWRKGGGYTEWSYRRFLSGLYLSHSQGTRRSVPACLISALSGSCWDEKLKNNAIMPNSIEKNNLFSPLPPFVLFKPLIPILEEVGPSTQIFSSIVI